jgi:hypothetical protein
MNDQDAMCKIGGELIDDRRFTIFDWAEQVQVVIRRKSEMRMVLVCVAALLIAGCAHSGGGGGKSNENGRSASSGLLNSTNAPPGSVYNVKVYVVKRGDTLSAIGSRFHKSVSELSALNPTINPNRLRIGEKIRVAEDKAQ